MANNKTTKNIWDLETNLAFISIWEKRIDELRSSRKNTYVHADMSKDMENLGYKIRPCDVKYKIYNLTKKYRKCKSRSSIDCSPESWQYFDAVHRIIGTEETDNLEVISLDSQAFHSNIDFSNVTYLRCTPSPTTDYETVPCSSNLSAEQTITVFLQKNNELTEKLIEIEREKLEHIKKLTENVIQYLDRKK